MKNSDNFEKSHSFVNALKNLSLWKLDVVVYGADDKTIVINVVVYCVAQLCVK